MSTLYEYYNTGDDGQVSLLGSTYYGQTFTPSEAHKITSVKLLLYRKGSSGTITVRIRATSGGLPTGGNLCSGTTDGNTLPTESPYEWREITLGDGYDLEADTQYAIVVEPAGTDANNRAFWRYDGSDPTYAGGNYAYGENGNWNGYDGADFMFEEWGEAGGVTHYASATLSGVGTLAGIGRGIFIGKSTLSGIGTLSAIGSFWQYGAATLSGMGTLDAIGRGIFTGKTTLSGIGTLVSVGRLIAIGKATLSGIGTLTASATLAGVIHYAKATLTGVGTLRVAAKVFQLLRVKLSRLGISRVGISRVPRTRER